MNFHNQGDLTEYLKVSRPPDLYVQHGCVAGSGVLQMLENRAFRVFVPALRIGQNREGNFDAECYLVDDERFLDDRSMMYIPVVHTEEVRPSDRPKRFDFIYLAEPRASKRHDIVIDAARRTGLSGHFHPVEEAALDLEGTRITTTAHNRADPVEMMQAARFAVYAGDHESSPAAMWECVACDLPIVVNEFIEGGRHVVAPGITGELAHPDAFADVMSAVAQGFEHYSPRNYLLEHWGTIDTLDAYLAFFDKMGCPGLKGSG